MIKYFIFLIGKKNKIHGVLNIPGLKIQLGMPWRAEEFHYLAAIFSSSSFVYLMNNFDIDFASPHKCVCTISDDSFCGTLQQ